MQLCWIHPTPRTTELEALWQALATSMSAIVAPGNRLDFRFLENSGGFTRSLYAEHLNSVLMVEAAIQAQDEDYDGVLLGCWNDPLWEAREMLDIPVASVGEQSLLAALTMGHRFAVVTVAEKTAFAIERDIQAYGLSERAIRQPVRTIRPFSDTNLLKESLTHPESRFLPRFENVARQCIADGAEIILVGCAYYGPLLRRAGHYQITGTAVPIVDASAIAVKYLEAMTGVAQTTSLVKSYANAFAGVPSTAIEGGRDALSLR
ncbi:aspartate/glutamate racemase family protein [Chromohalobacter israelensis]|uniref:Hydantoin racemase-like protein n=1 Tax=Chromohalobacter israelensis (strain ATCC BAA-138 / DSM 3043 / CIP 106854 / NCIMB 13768 / 1H11) TaxID=290398 RepID=Q1QXP1_CHRI1|nr:aspartate/glutamate racemase family protein [Chromohalobacter salexigens]ABE58767.1 Hydantoin racemase-like protein [Chromohalobacter salexigens DSM 3043]